MRSIKAMFLLSGGWICIGVAAGQQSVKDDVSDQTLRVQKIKADYQHSIDFLSNGIRHSWTVEDYRGAMGGPQTHIGACNAYIQMILQPRTMWDERLPFDVEVKQALTRCRDERDRFISALHTSAAGNGSR
jgi:hypothetical protein